MTASNVYDEFDKATGNLTAYAVSKGAHPVGRIVLSHKASCRAFVQVWCAAMKVGRANGGGYDLGSAAVESAIAALQPGPDGEAVRHIAKWQKAMKGDSGYDWRRRLEDAGYTVQHVLG